MHRSTCAISHSCQEDMRSRDLKKVAQPLDTFDNVIYVTLITTDATTDFVSASACNPSFGQGYAHQPRGEKSMKNKDTSVSDNTNLVADENGNINCTNCENCKNCADCLNCSNCTDCTDCIDCKNCYHCGDCKNCNNCSGCTECESCEDCGDRVNNVSMEPIERHRDDEKEVGAE